MATMLTQEEIKQLEQAGRQFQETKDKSFLESAFKIFDRNGDGKVNATELKIVMSSLANKLVSDAQVQQAIKAADKNGDGVIDINEFIDAAIGN